MKISILLCFFCSLLFSQVSQTDPVKFDDYFLDKTLRIDYYHTGNDSADSYSIDELKEEPYWGGSKTNLIDKFNYGKYKVAVLDEDSKMEIYTRTYSTLFGEWQTTEEAKNITKTFPESVVIPFPKDSIIVEFFTRDRNNNFIKKLTYKINPESYFITTEMEHYDTARVLYSGDPSTKVDIVFLPEGYTENEMKLFMEHCEKFANALFEKTPFKENRDKFNIWAVKAPSKDHGTDIPPEDQWRKTLLNSTFYTFDLQRYIMTSDYQQVRDVAANAPYDQIVILANTDLYGGGAIYNYYSLAVSKNPYSELVLVHEFGHGFSSLADEYSEKDSPYKDFYNLNVEPAEPNLTTLIDFDSKWKDLVDESTPIPTPASEKYEAEVGAFEGGGYLEADIYRPMQNCLMRSFESEEFCAVCGRTIREMINFYSH